jgi:carbon-monoxide dehydrogenase medium subunit
MVRAADFFRGYFTTALEPDEVLVEVRFPIAPRGTAVRFEEAVRREGDFAMVGAVAALRLDGTTIADARLALVGVADVPVRATEAEQLLVGSAPDDETFAAAADAAVRDLRPPSDLHASAAYRRRVAGVLVRRALAGATAAGGAA